MSEQRLELRIHGEFEIWNGKYHRTFRNKIVGQGLKAMVFSMGNNSAWAPGNLMAASVAHCRVGTGTGATANSTIALVTENATAPSSAASPVFDGSVPGTYRLIRTWTWNAGAIAALVVTEIGTKGNLLITSLVSSTLTTNALFSRLSTTDAEFTGFTIDTTKPLTIEHRLVFTFA